MKISADKLRDIVSYSPESGNFTAKVRMGRKSPGDLIGTVNVRGYVIFCPGRGYDPIFAHRAAWLYMTGNMPDRHIDHVNGIRSDNRWSNLRLATNAQNLFNRGKNRNNHCGYKGVRKIGNKWTAAITVKRKQIWLGSHSSPTEAHAAYLRAARELHGEFFYGSK